MKRIQAMTLLAALALIATAWLAAPATAAEAGEEIFLAQKCNLCHGVSTVGIESKAKSEKMMGPDLVDIDMDAEWIASFLKKEVDLDGKKHMKAFSGSDEELQALIDWLLAQKTE